MFKITTFQFLFYLKKLHYGSLRYYCITVYSDTINIVQYRFMRICSQFITTVLNHANKCNRISLSLKKLSNYLFFIQVQICTNTNS